MALQKLAQSERCCIGVRLPSDIHLLYQKIDKLAALAQHKRKWESNIRGSFVSNIYKENQLMVLTFCEQKDSWAAQPPYKTCGRTSQLRLITTN